MNNSNTYITFALLLTGAALIYKRFFTMNTTNISAEDKQTLPRGYRNNNPLNIRYNAANNWQGKVLPNTDGAFEQFETMEHGYRAALYLIRKYIRNYGLQTVADLISRWAPNTENNTAGYISRVCKTTGLEPATVITADDRDKIEDITYAMAIVENGATILPDRGQIHRAWDML